MDAADDTSTSNSISASTSTSGSSSTSAAAAAATAASGLGVGGTTSAGVGSAAAAASAAMPLEGSYAIWNNRGGSGKTTLTYHLAQKFAIKHPDKTILLIDMCPQCDLSHALLGDDEITHSDYVNQLCTLKKEPMLIGDQRYPKTVSGYLDLCTSPTSTGPTSNLIDPRTFLLNVSKFNPQLSRNLYLLCGDSSLELIARSLEEKRNQHPSLSHHGAQAWKHVTCALKHFIRKIAERKGIKLVVFIDVASSFSIITELALAAADKILVPVTEDHLHRNGFEYMFALLYGFSHPSNVYYYYRHYSFYYRANQHDVKLPKIHLILNKIGKSSLLAAAASTSSSANNQGQTTTTTSSLSPSPNVARAVGGGGGGNGGVNNSSSSPPPTTLQPPEIKRNNNETEWEFVFDVFRKHPQAFNLRPNKPVPQSLDEFKQEFVLDVCEQESLCNEHVRLAVKSHSPLLSSVRKPQANAANHAHSSSLSINIPSSPRTFNANFNNNSNIRGSSPKSASVVSSPNNSIRMMNHQSAAASIRSSFNAIGATLRKTSASASPPPTQSSPRKGSAMLTVSTQHDVMQDTLSQMTANTYAAVSQSQPLQSQQQQQSSSQDSNAILLFDKLLDKIVDGLIVTNER